MEGTIRKNRIEEREEGSGHLNWRRHLEIKGRVLLKSSTEKTKGIGNRV